MQGAQQVGPIVSQGSGRVFGPGRAVAGLEFDRYFTKEGGDPFDEIDWELRSAVIANERGELVFEQRDVEFPKFWSQQATNIVVSKYFRGQIGTPERERSVRQLIGRVVDTITAWAREQEYFASEDDLQAFSDDLKHLLVYQKGSFNSPVWFNCGFEKAPQCSACFINAVQDTMESILTLAKTEGMLFKFGSGTGSNLSAIRSSKEVLAGGGTASGPVSFMKGFDAFAPRGQDGDPQRGSSGHRRLHQLQGGGREEGVGAHRRRVRRLVHRAGVRVGVLSELEQLGARDRRVHAGGARRRRLADAGGDHRRGDGHL
jgi:ribonucleoside-diphosphate reductase alpha chain